MKGKVKDKRRRGEGSNNKGGKGRNEKSEGREKRYRDK